jgi:hypothetical protein
MKTLSDFNRREINFHQSKVSETLPEHYLSEYPNLIAFLDKYYEFMDSDSTYNFAAAIHSLYEIRDVQDTSINFLDNILKEIGQGLLNQNFFLDPRFATRLLSDFYRVKGSLYSSEGFFRAFYRSEIEISYPKRDIFIVGESEIGVESLKVIQDGALYQIYSILVKSEIPFATWRELYKAFVHPAGFFLGAQTLIISSADLDLEDMPDTIPEDSATPTFITSVTSSPFATTEITELVTYADSDVRITINETIAQYQDLTFGEVAGMYDDIRSLIEDTSPTFDDDSDVNGSAMDFSNIIETVDQNRNEYWYEDSDAYLLQIT